MADKSSRKIVGFKKFSDIKTGSKIEEIDPSTPISADTDSDIPMNPNLPKGSGKIEKPASRKNLMPKDQDINLQGEDDDEFDIDEDDKKNESNVKTFGRVAKFPKNIKASKAFNFLENVKVPKKSIWYIMVEKDNELQMVKYNVKEGVDLNKFVNELKSYYLTKYAADTKVCKLIEGMKIDGNDKYSMIKNIPLIKLENGRPIISKITEDLIKLLSK